MIKKQIIDKRRQYWLGQVQFAVGQIGWGFKSLGENLWRVIFLKNPPWMK